MRKDIFVLAILLVLFRGDFLQAQCTCTDQNDFGLFNPLLICENFESYGNGANFPVNNSRWTFRPGTTTYGKIQTTPNSANKALFIARNTSTSPNLLLKLGNKTSGRYRVSWQMYTPMGKTAYYKFQHAEDADSYAFEVAFGANGIGTVNRLQQTSSRFSFFIGAWNKVAHIVDLDTDQIELWINDEYIDSWKFSCGVNPDYNYCFFKVLSAVNFYGAPDSEFYVDDICMWQAVSNPVISFFRVCLKNGQSYEGGAGVATTNGLYTSNEFAEEDCPDVCSFAGLNVKNSLKYSNGTKIPVSKITNESILPNAIINIPCLKDFFAFEATHKQFRGQIYPFTATTSSLYVDLIFQTGIAGNVEIALVECTGNQNYSCVTDPKTDGSSHFFTVQPGKNYIIILLAIREVEFLIDISTEDLPKECYEIIRPKSYAPSCICQEFERALSTSTTLVNVKTGVLSLSSRVFQEASKEYLGGEKAYRIILDQPGLVDLTISSTNQGYALFLAGSECDDNLLALAETQENGGSASISKYLEAGVYHVIIDQLRLDNNSTFQLVYTASEAGVFSRPALACPVNQSSTHQVSIRSNPLTLDGDVLTVKDRIYLLNPRNIENRESNAANWNGQELNFILYGDATSDAQECGYAVDEPIEFAIVRQDKIYSVRPVFQLENGTDITGSNRFKKGGKSLISGFVSKLNVSNLGVGSIPALSANEKFFFVEVNSNENWRMERINPNKASWIEFSPANGTGIKDVAFKALRNQSTQARTDTVLVINDQGFYKSIIITQPGCTGPSVNAGPDKPICAGQNVTLTASGVGTITWENPGLVSNPSLITPTLNATQTFTAYATIGGCSASDQVTVNVSPKPNAYAGPDQTICPGSKAVLNASGEGAYTWSNGATTTKLEVNPTTTTTYTLTVTTQSGCTASDQVVVVVNRATASAGADRSICRGDSTILQATGVGTYLWSSGKTDRAITVSPSSDQVYQVTVSNSGCSATAAVKVTVTPLPQASAGLPQTICLGEPATLSASGGGTYLWNTTADTQNITVSPTQSTDYTVTVTQNGCSNTAQVRVTVNSATANAGPDQSICAGQSVILTASGGGTYQWSTNADTASITLIPNQTQTYTVTVTQNACTATDQVVVTVRPLPMVNAGLDQSICIGESALLTASGGGSYKWSTTASTSSITVVPLSTQTFSVTATQEGCTASDEVVVAVKPLPSANAGPDLNICAGQNAVLNASGGSLYKWSTSDTTSSISLVPTNTQTFTVTVTQDACESTDEVLVTVKPLPTANAGPDQSICAGQSTVLNATGGSAYKWSGNLTTASINISPIGTQLFTVTVTQNDCEATDEVLVTVKPLPSANAGPDQSICAGQNAVLTASGGNTYKWNNNATASSITVVPANTETFTVTVTQNGCDATDQLTVTVRPLPIANAGPDLSICAKQSAMLTAAGGNIYQWSNNATTASITISPTATQVFTVTVSQNECESVDEVRVTVRPLPNANAGPDQSICAGQSVVLNATGGGTYKWSNSATMSNISVNPLATQSYTLTVTQNDCEAIDQVIITVNANPTIKLDSSQFKAGINSFILVSVIGGTAPYQYQWSRNDTLVSAQEDLLGVKSGIHKLMVTDALGCTSVYTPGTIVVTSSRDLAVLEALNIYPNPTQGQLRIEGRLSKKETVQVSILDATGKYIWRSDVKTTDEFLYAPDLSNLAKGMYIIQFNVSGDLVYRKLILH